MFQIWEGFVLEVGRRTFRAQLKPPFPLNVDLETEIALEWLDPEDGKDLKPGVLFSFVVFDSGEFALDFPDRYTKEEIDSAAERAKGWLDIFDATGLVVEQ